MVNFDKKVSLGPLFQVQDLAVQSLPDVDVKMARFRELRSEDRIPDQLLLLSHPPSLAVGARKFNPEHLLKPLEYFTSQGIAFHKQTRGGGLTYHWPGQLNVYPVIKLLEHEQSLPRAMYRLEEVALRTLADFGVDAHRKRDQTAQIGLWHQGRKVASMGIFVSRWITSYGFALNLGDDHQPSNFIHPCGLKGVKLVTIEEIIGKKPDPEKVKEQVIFHFTSIFQRRQLVGESWN